MVEDTVTLDGLRIRYHVEGQGPDVLLIHGWVASRRMWAHVTRGLAARYRCWAVDLPGYGDSDKPQGAWYSIPRFTSVLRDFMLALGIARACVVGHSMGGMITLDFAATHPELVEKLVAINPVVTGRTRLRPLARFHPRWLDLTLRLSPLVLQPALRLSAGLSDVPKFLRQTEDFTKAARDAIVNGGHAVIAYDVSPSLGRIAAPALVIVGRHDLQVPADEGRLAAARIPDARLVEMRAGHTLTDDRPAETLRHLREFLA